MITQMNVWRVRLFFLSIAMFLLIAGVAQAMTESIGQVVAVRGVVQAVDTAGEVRLLQSKTELFAKDTIKTSQNARIQMLFLDNTIISLGGNSEMVIAEYRWDGIERNGAMKTEIKDGVFRVIGGLITEHSPEEFLTETPIAAIGIRGSMYAGLINGPQLDLLFLGGTGVDVGNDQGSVAITQPGFGTNVMTGQAPQMPRLFSAQDVAPIAEGLSEVGGSMIQEITGAEGTTVIESEGEECYGPDCAWYQKLLNTLEEAEDKAYASRACMEHLLELEIIHRDSYRSLNQHTEDQMNRTMLAWQTAKVLRSIAKGAWEAAMFLSGDPSGVVDIIEKMTGTMYGSDETEKGIIRMGGMAGLDKRALKAEASAKAKGEIREMLEAEGFDPSAARTVSEGLVQTVNNSIEAGQKGGFTKMLVADVVANSLNGYVEGLNEERMERIRALEGDLSAEGAVIAAASDRILALMQAIPEMNSLIANIRTEKEKLLALARECRLQRRTACWDAYDAAVKGANAGYKKAIQALDDAESAKSAEVDAAAEEANTLRQRLIDTYEEIGQLEKESGDELDEYRRTKSDLEIAEEAKTKAQDEASKFARESGTAGYSQPFTDLITDLHNEIQDLKAKLKPLEEKAKPINDRLEELRAQADADYPKLQETQIKQAELEAELDALKAENEPKREAAQAERDQKAEAAQAELDACLKRASEGMDTDATLQYSMTRKPGADLCDRMRHEAQEAYEAVKRNNHPRQIKIPCPKKTGITGPPPLVQPPPIGGGGTGSPPPVDPPTEETSVTTGETCTTPLETEPVELGPKSEIGGGLAKAVDEFASKMVSKGLGSLLGGGGFSFGGGGGGGGDDVGVQGPTTHKNPVKDLQPFNIPGTDITVNVGGMINDDGQLLISSEIDNAPGKGTYHSITLHNMGCKRMYPVRYIPYGLYLEWSLSVQYTYITEHYVDGELVNRTVEQTDWMEVDSGEELLGTGVLAIRGKDVRLSEPGVWQQFGFDRATAGINELGAVFNVGWMDLQEPLAVSINITQPDLDPVMAAPLNLFLCPKDGKINFVPVDEFMDDLKLDYKFAKAFEGGMTEIDPPSMDLSAGEEPTYEIDPKRLLESQRMGGGMTQIDPPSMDLDAGGSAPVDSVVDDLQPYNPSGQGGAAMATDDYGLSADYKMDQGLKLDPSISYQDSTPPAPAVEETYQIDPKRLLESQRMGGGMTQIDPPTIDLDAGPSEGDKSNAAGAGGDRSTSSSANFFRDDRLRGTSLSDEPTSPQQPSAPGENGSAFALKFSEAMDKETRCPAWGERALTNWNETSPGVVSDKPSFTTRGSNQQDRPKDSGDEFMEAFINAFGGGQTVAPPDQ